MQSQSTSTTPMLQNINQAEHNEKFHSTICSHSKDKFFDWKITCLFYVAIHALKALAKKNGKNIGATHKQIEISVSPQKSATIMPLPQKAWDNYHNLYRYSKTARYSGFTEETTFEKLKEMDHNHCLQCLNGFKGYIKGQGVPLL